MAIRERMVVKLVFVLQNPLLCSMERLQNSDQQNNISQEFSKCLLCGSSFTGKFHKYNLKKHMDIHQGWSRFACQQCGKLFNRRYNLDRHVERIHNILSVIIPSTTLPDYRPNC
ncbi:unnamed protein product [Meganyctiphanes norvegica]|uniref:C2H2-type domain-containing protein n=1 Tax=Meganyctiphanes norvegica TaxID=48144 RepID=A0AAV2PNI3_MEGNR